MSDKDNRHIHSFSRTSSSIPVAEPLRLPETLGGVPAGVGESSVFTIDPSVARRAIDPTLRARFDICVIDLREGCYIISFNPKGMTVLGSFYKGTMRVDRAGNSLTISGDLYRFPRVEGAVEVTGGFTSDAGNPDSLSIRIGESFVNTSTVGLFYPVPLGIPVYPRKNYYSYLKVVDVDVQTGPVVALAAVQIGPELVFNPCTLRLTIDEFVYTHPPAGSFDGSFPSAADRRLTAVLSPASPPAGFQSVYFEGKLFEGSVELGAFSMGWVSSRFRRATLEIDTLQGAVAPQPVVGEDFRTIFATAGWNLAVDEDQTDIPVPSGVDAAECWSMGDLHALMASVRKATTDLDKEWRTHLVVVPAKIGCSRGVMYDTISVPREGSASFSDDGYPEGDSSNFGTAEGEKQRDVPRAFIRSAAHEVGHAFNQIHQNCEDGPDNSIMTTTPRVANFLGGLTTGAAGVFPDDINLSFNVTVRHHLVHYPDPVVRPGGESFLSCSPFSGPEADLNRFVFSSDQMELRLVPGTRRLKLAESLPLRWELTNHTNKTVEIPSDINPKGGHVNITVTNPAGQVKRMGSFIIQTDAVTAKPLAPGKSASGETFLFWSAGNAFAFETPGIHRIDLRILWVLNEVPVLVKASADVFVDYPVAHADNEVAAALLHREVGMVVALGGGAEHLKEGTSRIERTVSEHPDHPASKRILPLAAKKKRHSKRLR